MSGLSKRPKADETSKPPAPTEPTEAGAP